MGKLFYGTQTGMAEDVAGQIQAVLPHLITSCIEISRAKPADLEAEEFLVLGGSNWGDGELTDDWIDFWPKLDSIDFTGKKVALFSLGDAVAYGDSFCSAMRCLYDKVIEQGGTIIGHGGTTSEYDFSYSDAVIDARFVGLAIDDMNEFAKTEARIERWAHSVQLALAAVEA